MTKEQARIRNRIAWSEKRQKRLCREIQLLQNKVKAKGIERSRLFDEVRRLREACKHDYKEKIVHAGVLGACAVCGDRRLLKEFPHPRNCDCIRHDGSQAHL